jgi:hypothetical protein
MAGHESRLMHFVLDVTQRDQEVEHYCPSKKQADENFLQVKRLLQEELGLCPVNHPDYPKLANRVIAFEKFKNFYQRPEGCYDLARRAMSHVESYLKSGDWEECEPENIEFLREIAIVVRKDRKAEAKKKIRFI